MIDVTIQELSRDNLKDVGKCDGTFTVDSQLLLSSDDTGIHFTIVATRPYPKRYPPEEVNYKNYFGGPDRVAYLAYVDGKVSGQIRLSRHWNNYAYIEDIVVDVEFRRLGIGRTLIRKAVEWAKTRQLPGVMLETQNNNVAASLLYQSCGLELCGFDRKLYQGLDPDTPEIALYWYLQFPATARID